MKREILTQVKAINPKPAEEFQEEFNKAMTALAGKSPQYKIDFSERGFSAVITYTEVIETMDCVADEYHAKGIKYTCQECPLREIQTDGRKRDAECKHAACGRATLKAEACEVFYRQLKLGAIEPKGEPTTIGQTHRLTEEDIEILRREETWKGKKIHRIGARG